MITIDDGWHGQHAAVLVIDDRVDWRVADDGQVA